MQDCRYNNISKKCNETQSTIATLNSINAVTLSKITSSKTKAQENQIATLHTLSKPHVQGALL